MKILAIGTCLVLTASLEAMAVAESSSAASVPENLRLGDIYLSDFYIYDSALDKPGMLLRQEPLTAGKSNPGAARNIRLLYSSTDGIDGKDLVAVSGVLFLPEGSPPGGGWPLMAWTHGTVGIADICAPSWSGRQQQDRDHLEFWLTNGFAVVATDYQGLGTPGTHPYLATRPEAYSNLDIIRAVQSGGFPLAEKVVLFGQSQGAGAAIATAAYATDYAPDVNVVGAVATGVPLFSPEALDILHKSRPPDSVDPLLAYNLLNLSLAQLIDPEFKLEDYVSEEVLPIARSIQNTCQKDLKAKVVAEKLTYNRVFKKSPAEHLTNAFSRMGYPRYDLPVSTFIGTGGMDRDTPPDMQAALIEKLCEAGSVIVSKVYPGQDHRGVVPVSTTDTLPFVKAAFAGEEIESNCARTEP
jgi:pimeloyl-ACP methyl ester carboxylesterase